MLNIIANIVLFLNDLISASLSNFAVSAFSPLFAPYPEFSTAFIMSATFALSGEYSTTAFCVARFTFTSFTPLSFLIAESTIFTQCSDSIPVMSKVASSMPFARFLFSPVIGLYPSFSISFVISSSFKAFSSYSTVAFSVAKFTLAFFIPLSFPSFLSMFSAHEAQCIPAICISFFTILLYTSN